MFMMYLIYMVIYLYVIKISKKALHMMQQNLYNENNRYLKWVQNNIHLIIKNLDLFGIVFAILIILTKNEILINIFLCIMIMVYAVSYYFFRERTKQEQNKKPLVITARVKRLIVTTAILYLIPLIVSFFTNGSYYCLLALTIITSLNFYMIFLSMIINTPIEKGIYQHYKNNAKRKLNSMPNLKIVGITGSYGKTSSKNILADILNVKYNALPTPRSLNTFNGLMITVNNHLSKFDDIFIAEMGAYVRGEITGLCKLVNPKYGIITSIGTAHLATFGSEENIQKGKMELIEYLPSDGVGVLNKDDPKQKNYKIKNDCKILWIGIDEEDVDVRATNIKGTSKGTTFDCIFKGDDKVYHFETKLLGKHNVYNILAGLALGREFGLKVEELQQGVKMCRATEHRLELKKLGNFYQIDDAYNSNPIGAKAALDVLGMMDGTKVVVTPGMIELGDREEELNEIFGEQISEVADYVILVGEKQTKPILKGLKNKKFKEDNIYVINDVRKAYTLVNELKGKKDLYALFENDLPDTYTEIGGK